MRFLRAYLDAIQRNTAGEMSDKLIEWYTNELSSERQPEELTPVFRTFVTRCFGCMTVSETLGFGGYDTVGGTGARLWEAGFFMCEFLAANAHLVQGKRILELGSGQSRSKILPKVLDV